MSIPRFDDLPSGLTLVRRDDPDYHYARQIANTRFGAQPTYVAYCSHTAHVQYCLRWCRTHNFPFRIRSGGHQHEGNSSGDGVMIVDLSQMNTIEYVEGTGQAWIPAGKQLGITYEELSKKQRTIPGGGCPSVSLGGLVQGCGLGMSLRQYGFACDALAACEIVLHDGTIQEVSATQAPDLFWALKGNGGGNFGIITRYLFNLCPLGDYTTTFRLIYTDEELVRAVMKRWAYLHTTDELPRTLSTYGRMEVSPPPKDKNPHPGPKDGEIHAVIGGQLYGDEVALKEILYHHFGTKLIEGATEKTFTEHPHNRKGYAFRFAQAQGMLSDFRKGTSDADFILPTASTPPIGRTVGDSYTDDGTCKAPPHLVLPPAPKFNCNQPHPHKVTSGYPREDVDHDALIDFIYDGLNRMDYGEDVIRYMSFHGLGGAVRDNPSTRAFAYAHKPYLLQLQSWWDDAQDLFSNKNRNEAYVACVNAFRKKLDPFLEGAFFNFADWALVRTPDLSPMEHRLALLEIYYGANILERLRTIKQRYDPQNVFQSPVSIPLPALKPASTSIATPQEKGEP